MEADIPEHHGNISSDIRHVLRDCQLIMVELRHHCCSDGKLDIPNHPAVMIPH
jgi:hypothetical protein